MDSTVVQFNQYGKIVHKDVAKWFKCGNDGWS